MSKGSSHLFTGTSGEGIALINEVIDQGIKISPEKVLMITKTPSGQIVWLETGDSRSGLEHIINNHGAEFDAMGITKEQLPNYILEAIYQSNITGTQGKRNPRTVYDFIYEGLKHRIAIQVGSNGYIVSANSKSIREDW